MMLRRAGDVATAPEGDAVFVYDWLLQTIKIGIIGGTHSALAPTVGGVIVGIFRPSVGKPIVIARIVCSALTVAAVVAGIVIISLGYEPPSGGG